MQTKYDIYTILGINGVYQKVRIATVSFPYHYYTEMVIAEIKRIDIYDINPN